MSLFLFLASLLLPSTAGYVILCGESALTPGEKAIFSFTLGSGLLSFYFFSLGLFGVDPSLSSSTPFFALFWAAGALRWKAVRKGLAVPDVSLDGVSLKKKIVAAVICLMVVVKIVYLIFMVSTIPTVFWDSQSLWNYKAKMLYYGAGAEKVFFGGPNAYYPLNLPIMRAWISYVVGHWSETFVNLHSVVLFLCLIGLVFLTVARKNGPIIGLIFAYIVSSLPILVTNTFSGYADMAVAYYFLASGVMLYHWRRTGRGTMLAMAGILASVAMFTKNEGIGIVFPSLFAALACGLYRAKRSWRYFGGMLSLFVISSCLIWGWLIKSGALSMVVEISGLKGGKVAVHGEGVKPLLQQMFLDGNYNIFWAGVLLILLFRWRLIFSSEAIDFLLPAAFALVLILYIFLFTDNVQWLLNGTTINRTVLLTIPLLAVASGFLAGSGESFAIAEGGKG